MINKTLPEWSFLEGVELKCVVANGLAYAKKVMQRVKEGTGKYHFIEIMACPGGCLGGGGQPIPTNPESVQNVKPLYTKKIWECPFVNLMRTLKLLKSTKNSLENPLGINHMNYYIPTTLPERGTKITLLEVRKAAIPYAAFCFM